MKEKKNKKLIDESNNASEINSPANQTSASPSNLTMIKYYYKPNNPADRYNSLTPFIPPEYLTGELFTARDALNYLQADSEYDLFAKAENNHPTIFNYKHEKIDYLNILVWHKFGKNIADKIKEKPQLNLEALQEWIEKGEWKDHLADFEYITKTLQKELLKFGIVLILTPYLYKTAKASVLWHKNRPIIMISSKFRVLMETWIALFHCLWFVQQNRGQSFCFTSVGFFDSRCLSPQHLADIYVSEFLFNGSDLMFYTYAHKTKEMIPEVLAEHFKVPVPVAEYWICRATRTKYKLYLPDDFSIQQPFFS